MVSLTSPLLAAGQKVPRLVQKSGEELLARIIKWQEPVLPPIARQARAGGPVVVDLTIDEKGDVVGAHVVSGHPLLQMPLLHAARAWKFRPAGNGNVPVRMHGRIKYLFPSTSELNAQKTIEELEKEVQLKPNSSEAHYDLGNEYLKLKRYDEAKKRFNESIRIDPNFARAHVNLGHTLSRLRDFPQAIEAFTKATQLDPNYAEAFMGLGLANMVLEKYEAAIDAFKISLKVPDPITDAYFMLGKSYVLLGRPKEAVGHYKQGLSQYPDSERGHFGLGEAYLYLEQYAEAVNELKEAARLSLPPGNSLVHFHLGLAFFKNGNSEAAFEEYEKLKKLDVELAGQLMHLIKK